MSISPIPSRPSPTTRTPRLATTAVLLAALSTFLLPGCKATPAYQGGTHPVLATYRFRTLTAQLPATMRVPAVMAAARQALADRGYAVQFNRTEDDGKLIALPPGGGDFDRTVVRADEAPDGTWVQITIEPGGGQPRARAILDGILTRLGM